MSNTVIENYEPDDRGWGIVIGPFMRPPVEHEHEHDHDDVVDDDDVHAQ